MSTIAERLDNAMKLREKKQSQIDDMLKERFHKKHRGAYTHAVLFKGMTPDPEQGAAIAEYLEISYTWLMTGQGPMDREETLEGITYDSLPGWVDAAKAEIQLDRIPEYAIRAAGRCPAAVKPERITPDFVRACALFWLDHVPNEERKRFMASWAERLKKAEDDKPR